MKKNFIFIMVVSVVALTAFMNLKFVGNGVTVSDLALANIEAFANNGEDATITCSRSCGDGIGKCWRVIDQYGNCQSSGNPYEYCVCKPW